MKILLVEALMFATLGQFMLCYWQLNLPDLLL